VALPISAGASIVGLGVTLLIPRRVAAASVPDAALTPAAP